mgnify:CR=1 FL=1
MADAEKWSLKAAIIPVTPLQQNCSLIWDAATGSGAVVDPGGDVTKIQEAIAQVGMKPDKIVLTHGHIDHAGGAAELKQQLGVPIEGPHLADKFLLEGLEEQGREYGIAARNVLPDLWLTEPGTLNIGGHDLEILNCPGHSPGSLVFVNHAHKFILMGDVLFQGSIGRTDLPLADLPTDLDLGWEDAGLKHLDVVPEASGTYRIHGRIGDDIVARSNPMVVSMTGARVFWGDLHGHSGLSDGTGTPADYLAYARDAAALDGFGHLQFLWRVALPLTRPVSAAALTVRDGSSSVGAVGS